MATEKAKPKAKKITTISDLLAPADMQALIKETIVNLPDTEILIIVTMDKKHEEPKTRFAGPAGPFTLSGILGYAQLQVLSEDSDG